MEPNLISFQINHYPKDGSIPVTKSSSRSLLDSDGCISLSTVLNTFDAPINENHAWALCYLSLKHVESHSPPLVSPTNSNRGASYWMHYVDCTDAIKMFYKTGQIVLDIDSIVRGKDILMEDHEKLMQEIVSHIAMAIYKALDYGIKEDEERTLSYDLENILELMLSTCDNVLKIAKNACLVHCRKTGMKNEEDIKLHCQQVCKNLLMDTLDFAKFLRIADRASKTLRYVQGTGDFAMTQWPEGIVENNFKSLTKAWIHVVRELRNGVKLKRSNVSSTGSQYFREYEKTPYELLMEDIKYKRYKLRNTPHTEAKRNRDRHDVMMELIRSRPELKRSSERIIKPASPRLDPYEELMKSIRQVHSLRSVKPLKS